MSTDTEIVAGHLTDLVESGGAIGVHPISRRGHRRLSARGWPTHRVPGGEGERRGVLIRPSRPDFRRSSTPRKGNPRPQTSCASSSSGAPAQASPTPVPLDTANVWPYSCVVARTKVKATYSVDEETIRALERLARRLNVSKSEVLRRAIDQMARAGLAPGEAEESALDALQHRLALTTADADKWVSRVRRERLASTRL